MSDAALRGPQGAPSVVDGPRLRVLVTPTDALRPWQRAAVDRLRDVAEVITGSWAQPPDVVVDFNGGAAADEARIATLRYGFANSAPDTADAPGTWARLYRVAPGSNGVVLAEGWFRATSEDGPGIDDPASLVAGWCTRVVRQLAEGDRSVLDGDVVDVRSCAAFDVPSARWSQSARMRSAWRRWRRRERWTVGIVDESLPQIIRRGAMPEPRWIRNVPRDRYVADPFPLSCEGNALRILAEEYAYATGRGELVELTVARDGTITGRSSWLAMQRHLAYPFVFDAGTETVCVPDASASGSVYAYALDPERRNCPATLLKGVAAVDPTMVHYDGRWWLFCTLRGPHNQTDLHVFFADEWNGPWRPHAFNPVKSDMRSSRPAGACFTMDGNLHRPAQDCSRRYGGAIAINRVEVLTPTRFRERTLITLRPDPRWSWPDGMHTINAAGDCVVVDGLRVER